MNFEVIENGQVLSVEEVKTQTQTATVKEYYDQEFHTKLTTDKAAIPADGTTQATITASVYNYLDEAQSAWTGDIVFELDGEKQIIPAKNGQASITFSTGVSGEYVIRTNIPEYRNGEVTIHAE